VFGQDIYVYLNSPKWQERSQALTLIIDGLDEFLAKENSSLAFNQIIQMYSFNEKNHATAHKHLQLYSALAGKDSFKFDNIDTMIAFTLDKFIEPKSETQSEQTYFSFLKRNNNEEFSHNLALLV